MRGRRVLMESFVSHGVRHIFGNPGTTETPLLDSLPAFPQIEYIMALHEGVAVSAASFYAQASGRVTVANLHVAPGLGNGIGSLYGALKAISPVVVTAGQQDTRMRLKNPLLGHDLVAMAAPVTKWSVQIERADEIAPILRRAFKVATDARHRAQCSYRYRSTSWNRKPQSMRRRRIIGGDRRGPIRLAWKRWPRCC